MGAGDSSGKGPILMSERAPKNQSLKLERTRSKSQEGKSLLIAASERQVSTKQHKSIGLKGNSS